jgi:hypothetical protein
VLVESLEEVRRGKMDSRKASSISALSGQVLRSCRLDLEFIRLQRSSGKFSGGCGSMRLLGPVPKMR